MSPPNASAALRVARGVATLRPVLSDSARPDGGEVDFEQAVEDALDSLPPDLRDFMSNVAVVIEDDPPAGMPLLRPTREFR
jgi:hypothetical protein